MSPKTNADYGYGQYAEMFGEKDLIKAAKIFDKTARRMGVNYAVVGGSAVYLLTHNPPEDYPDLDVLLDADKAAAVRFIKELEKQGYKVKLLDTDLPDEVFAITRYGRPQIDIFTNQEERRGKSEYRRMLRVRSVPELIVEKLIRATREDLLMVIDLLNCAKYDEREVLAATRKRRVWVLYLKVRFLAEGFRIGKVPKALVSIMVTYLARGEQ